MACRDTQRAAWLRPKRSFALIIDAMKERSAAPARRARWGERVGAEQGENVVAVDVVSMV